MGVPEIALGVALFGTGLSTALAVLKVFEYRYAQAYQLLIIPKVASDFSSIGIDVVNLGKRPITIRSVAVVYGLTAESGTEVGRLTADFPKRLEEAYLFTGNLPRSDLTIAASSIPSLQCRYSSLWVVATAVTGQRFVRRIAIDEAIIPGESFGPARPFIAADLFLNLPRLAPEPGIPVGMLHK